MSELLISLDRATRGSLGRELERELRDAVREGRLLAGTPLPSTRGLAAELGISRGVVVRAYGQLAAEGYLVAHRGSGHLVARAPSSNVVDERADVPTPPRARVDFRPGLPDLAGFPRSAWARSLRVAVHAATDADLGYGEARGADQLRRTLASWLGRVRGVVASPSSVLVTSGFSQGLGIVCRALAQLGAARLGMEDPSHAEQRALVRRAGLEPVPVPVDVDGLRVDLLDAAGCEAVLVTPAHQFPTGAVLGAERRAALLDWAGRRHAFVIEDDYDAEYRYDRMPVGALQGLACERVVYAGSVSKTLAPALRLGWLVVPQPLLALVAEEKRLADLGSPRLDQLALADFIERGEHERHLRRMRLRYRARRDALVAALTSTLPGVEIAGVAAGLHLTARLPAGCTTEAVIDRARRRGVAVAAVSEHSFDPTVELRTLVLGYAHLPEPAIRLGVHGLAAAVHATISI